jgi:glycosyltransferase involved in cell wall biosynthesis
MPVHNREAYVFEAVSSILNQTVRDLELIIINDFCNDRSMDIINSIHDDRIIIINNEQNLGITKSLNKGIRSAKGRFIARMDDDDISHPKRFERELEFLESHPDISVVGTYPRLIGDQSGIWELPRDNDLIVSYLIFQPMLVNPSTILRREVFDEYLYDESFLTSEDYELWTRVAKKYKFHNINEVLISYRRHPGQSVVYAKPMQIEYRKRIQKRHLAELGIDYSEGQLQLHADIGNWVFHKEPDWVNEAGKWLIKLKIANSFHHIFPEPAFTKMLSIKWLNICAATGSYIPWLKLLTYGIPEDGKTIRFDIPVSISTIFHEIYRKLWPLK